MKKPISCLVAFFICYVGQSQDKWDLQRCVNYALANNISVKLQDVQARLAKLTYEQSKLSQYPSLNLTANAYLNSGRNIDRATNQYTSSPIFNNTFGLQSNVDIFSFFSKQNIIAANKFETLAAGAYVDKIKNDIALNVAVSYLQVLLAKQQVEIMRVKQQQTSAQLVNTRKLVNAGAVPELNSLQLEAQLAQDSSGVVTAKSNEIQAYYTLKALLALDASAPFEVDTPPIDKIPVEPLADLQPESVYKLAMQNLPQQKVNSLRLLAAERNVAAAKATMYPSLSGFGSLQTTYSNYKLELAKISETPVGFQAIGVVNGTTQTVVTPVYNYKSFARSYGTQLQDNYGKSLGVSLSLPIFNGGTARTNWQRAKLNVKTYQLQQQQDSLTLKQDIYKAYTDAITALEKFNASNKAVETSQKALDFATKRWNIGLLNTLDLITTQSSLTSAQLSRSAAQFEYVFRMKLLEFYKGKGLKL